MSESEPAGDGSHQPSPSLRAALDAWERLAAFGWREHQIKGRGVVVIDRRDLLANADNARRLPLSYVPLDDIPAGDDVRPLVCDYDPHNQIVLLVGERVGDEQIYVMASDGQTRPLPAQCAGDRAD